MAIADIFKKKQEKKIDFDNDLDAIMSYLRTVGEDLKLIYTQCKKLKTLRDKEKDILRHNPHESFLQRNIIQQMQALDVLLKNYEFLENDTDINGNRAKLLAQVIRAKAKELNIDKEDTKIMNQDWWTFDW